MKKVDTTVLGFIKKHRISVLTTILPGGNPHSASLHYANSADPLDFFFVTDRESRKCKHFEVGKKYPASLVVGFSEEEFIEFQAEGEAYLVSSEKELDEGWKTYADKFKGADESKGSKKWILLKFVPAWWRYTEFKPKFSVLSSE